MSEGKEHGLAAGDRNRTDDHLFTKQVLYQLSYPGYQPAVNENGENCSR